MTEIIVRDPSLIQGVSQQAEDLRLPGQVRECLNGWASPVEGNTKRQGTKHLAKISDSYFTDAKLHEIDRGPDEKYTVLLGHKTLMVHDRKGTLQPIISETNLVGRVEDARSFLDTTRWADANVSTVNYSRHNANDTVAPDGSMGADLLSWADDGAGNTNNYTTLVGVMNDELFRSNEPYMLRLAMKRKDSTSNVHILWTDGFGNNQYVEVDLVGGTIIGHSGTDPLLTALPDSWYQLEIRLTHGVTTPATFTTIQIAPSAAGAGPATFGYGGVWFHSLEVLDVNRTDYSYLDLTPDNLLSDPETFGAAWTKNLITLGAGPHPTAPYGPTSITDVSDAEYDKQFVRADLSGVDPAGQVYQDVGTFFAGPQTFSCFFSAVGITDQIGFITVRFEDLGTGLNHGVRFDPTATSFEPSTITNDVLDYGVIDHGHGTFEAWVSVDPLHSSTILTTAGRRVEIEFSDTGIITNSLYIWGARLLNGVSTLEEMPYHDPIKSLDIVTVQDTSFISNSRVTPALSESRAPGTDPDSEAFIFVQRAEYGTQYKVGLTQGNSTNTVFVQVSNTVGTSDTLFHTWEFDITDYGSGNWSITVAGFVVTMPVPSALSSSNESNRERTARTARAFSAAINASMKANAQTILSSSTGSVVTIRSSVKNVPFTVSALVPAGTGAAVGPTLRIDSALGTSVTLRFADTSMIADDLAGQLGAISGITASSANSVVRIVLDNGQRIQELEATDSLSGQHMNVIWRSVDFIDKLPTTCQDGFKIKVAGDPDSGADDYYVVFDADNQGAFGPGIWRETVAVGTPDEFDPATMPQQLVRRQDNSVGTWTGTASQIFFTLKPLNWAKCLVGSTELNPAPSFVGKPITGISYRENRLSLLADDNVILSESSIVENFWRTTVRDLIDSDPIDITSGTRNVVSFNHVLLTDQRMLLSSALAIHELVGTPLTPKTAALREILSYRNDQRCPPANTGRSFMFPYGNSQYTNVKEAFQLEDGVYDATEVSSVAPSYIPKGARQLIVSSAEDVAIILTSGEPGTAFIYKYFWNGQQKVQSSWGRWTFGTAVRILGAVFIQSELVLYLERADGVYIESMQLGDGLTDPGSTYATRLDRMLSDESPDVGVTKFSTTVQYTLPYTNPGVLGTNIIQVWTRDGDASGAGQNLPVMAINTTSVTISSTTLRDVYIGEKYNHEITVNQPLRKQQGPDQRSVYLEGRVQALRSRVAYNKAAEFDIQVTAGNRATQTTSFSDGVNTGSGLTLSGGAKSVPVRTNARDLTMVLSNTKATPADFLSVEHYVEHSPRA